MPQSETRLPEQLSSNFQPTAATPTSVANLEPVTRVPNDDPPKATECEAA